MIDDSEQITMSKIMRAMQAAARDEAKPSDERKRYSTDSDDAGWLNWRMVQVRAHIERKKFIVRLDGEIIDYVKTADEATGYVRCYEKPLRILTDGETIATYERRGVVRCELVPE